MIVHSIPFQDAPSTGDTKILQTALTAHGYNTNGIDDDFGGGTKMAVDAFLKDNCMNTGGIISLPMLKLLGIKFIPTIRKDGYSALSWEYHQPERQEWTGYAIQYIEQVFTTLEQAQDITIIRPDYKTLNKKQRINVWAEFISALAFPESGWSPTSAMVETTMGKDPVTGKQVRSEGLLQLSYQDQINKIYNHLPCRFNWAKDKQLADNDKSKTIFQPDINLEFGIHILASQIERKGKVLLESGVYWAVIKVGGKNPKIPQITTMVQNLSFV